MLTNLKLFMDLAFKQMPLSLINWTFRRMSIAFVTFQRNTNISWRSSEIVTRGLFVGKIAFFCKMIGKTEIPALETLVTVKAVCCSKLDWSSKRKLQLNKVAYQSSLDRHWFKLTQQLSLVHKRWCTNITNAFLCKGIN